MISSSMVQQFLTQSPELANILYGIVNSIAAPMYCYCQAVRSLFGNIGSACRAMVFFSPTQPSNLRQHSVPTQGKCAKYSSSCMNSQHCSHIVLNAANIQLSCMPLGMPCYLPYHRLQGSGLAYKLAQETLLPL